MESIGDFFGLTAKKIDRSTYFLANAVAFLISFCIVFAVTRTGIGSNPLAGILVLLFSIIELYIFIASSLHRIDDIGISRWLVLLSMIPIVAPLLLIYLIFKKGAVSVEASVMSTIPVQPQIMTPQPVFATPFIARDTGTTVSPLDYFWLKIIASFIIALFIFGPVYFSILAVTTGGQNLLWSSNMNLFDFIISIGFTSFIAIAGLFGNFETGGPPSWGLYIYLFGTFIAVLIIIILLDAIRLKFFTKQAV